MKKARVKQIEEMVANWNEVELRKEEYPTDEQPLCCLSAFQDSELVARAAREMGIEVAELREWFGHIIKEAERKMRGLPKRKRVRRMS